ncbi:MAG TPA: zinc dependent phospholipase C family protein [Chloroflexota bacterium]|nr:zinc dependent phospholipase C family protein [Chloroflexota bacterium]
MPSQLIHLEVCALALERRAAGRPGPGPTGQRGQVGEGRGAARASRGAFWLGAMAPDAWGAAGLTRGETHFWSLEDDTSGVVRLGRAYPDLCDPLRWGARERAFLAGYLCHLVTDEQWTFCVYRPFFGRHSTFGASAEGRMVQLALQGEWEQGLRDQKGPQLRGWLRELAGAEPGGLLPFLDGAAIARWRDLQLEASQLPASRLAFRYVLERSGKALDARTLDDLMARWDALAAQGAGHVPPEARTAFLERAGEACDAVLDTWWR